MEKNEIVINGVHHVLTDGWEEDCSFCCSLCEKCEMLGFPPGAVLCKILGGDGDSRFEIKNMQEDIINNSKELNPDFSEEVDEHFDELI